MMRMTIDINRHVIRAIRIIRREPLGDPTKDHFYEVYFHDRNGEEVGHEVLYFPPSERPLLLISKVLEKVAHIDEELWKFERKGSQYDPDRYLAREKSQ